MLASWQREWREKWQPRPGFTQCGNVDCMTVLRDTRVVCHQCGQKLGG